MTVDRLNPTPTTGGADSVPSKKLLVQTKSRFQTNVRDELMNTRKRHVHPASSGNDVTNVEEDIDTLLRHHNQMQDKLADEMIQLARNLKDNARFAGKVVGDDTKVRSQSECASHVSCTMYIHYFRTMPYCSFEKFGSDS